MKKLNKVILILLLIALFIGVTAMVASAALGAHPIQIGKTIVQETAERSSLPFFGGSRNPAATPTALPD